MPDRTIERDVAEVRAEMVARGRVLLADPNYPSKEEVNKVAALLAAHWSGRKTIRTRDDGAGVGPGRRMSHTLDSHPLDHRSR